MTKLAILEWNKILARTVSKWQPLIVHCHMLSSLRLDVVMLEEACVKSPALTQMFISQRYSSWGLPRLLIKVWRLKFLRSKLDRYSVTKLASLEWNKRLARTVSKRPPVIVHHPIHSSLRPNVVLVEEARAKSVGLAEMFTSIRCSSWRLPRLSIKVWRLKFLRSRPERFRATKLESCPFSTGKAPDKPE